MSIIQEALRRKAEETNGTSPLPSELPPPAPGTGRKRKAFWEIVGVLVGVAVAGIVLVAAVITGIRWFSTDAQEPIETGLETEAYAEPVAEIAEPDVAEEAVAEAPSDVPEPPEPEPALALIEPEPETEPLETETRVSEAPVPDVVAPDISEIMHPIPEPGEPASLPAEWPRITLIGVLTSRGGTGGSALFRDAPAGGVFEGETFRNVRVLNIRRDAVTVEYEGVRRVLRVGQSTGDMYE